MFGIGSSELLIILIVALLVLGPEHLPKIMRTVGKVMGDFRRISTDFQRTINTEVAVDEEKKKRQAEKKARQEAKEAARAEVLAELKAEAEAKQATMNTVIEKDTLLNETSDINSSEIKNSAESQPEEIKNTDGTKTSLASTSSNAGDV